MPYSYEVSTLHREVELRVLQRIARALGFSSEVISSPRGLSGIAHKDVLLGKREEGRHVVVFQSGFDQCLATELPPSLKGIGHSSNHDSRPLDVREEETRRGVLFSAYDLKASLEEAGWTCDVVYFLNMHSPEDHGYSLPAMLRDTLGPSLGHVPVRTVRTGSSTPVTTIPVVALERSALATGSSLIKLSDFSVDELIELASPKVPDTDSPSVNETLRRLGVAQFFKPPVDELMLGALSETDLAWGDKELALTGQVSKELKHEPAEAELFPDIDLDNPLGVIEALRRHKYLEVEADIKRLTKRGDEIVYRIKNRNRQSWHKRVSGIVDLLKKIAGLGSIVGS